MNWVKAAFQLLLAAPELLKIWFVISKAIDKNRRERKAEEVLDAVKEHKEATTREAEKTALEHIRSKLLK